MITRRRSTALAEAITDQGGQVVGNGSRAEDVVTSGRAVSAGRRRVRVGLTDGDGVDAARQVMASYPCALVVLTSRTEPEVAARAAEAGVLAFLAKPLRPEELGPALDLAVSRFRDLEAVRRENQELKRKLEARKLVDRAKALLSNGSGFPRRERIGGSRRPPWIRARPWVTSLRRCS